jgi:proteasome lid subunit RPN8/RPN11
MTVIIPKKVYQTIVAAAVRYANARIPEDDWLEVYGIFIGKNSGDDVFIAAAHPITHQVKRKEDVIDKVFWSDEDYVSSVEIEDGAFERNEWIVGWWHSHPGFKVMMSHIDIRTTLSYQQNNPLAVSLVFNPQRLIRQVELPDRKGDPIKPLEGDPGFKIYRLDDVNRGIEAAYHEADYKIEGYENMKQLVQLTQKFIIDVTTFFPVKNLFETYEKFISDRTLELDSKISGTDEYLLTLVRKGEESRIAEVLGNQQREIRKYVAETFIKIANIKEFMDYLEHKEREIIIPKVTEILSKWDESMTNFSERLGKFSKRFANFLP